MLFKNLKQIFLKIISSPSSIFLKKILSISLLFLLSACCADENDFGQNTSVAMFLESSISCKNEKINIQLQVKLPSGEIKTEDKETTAKSCNSNFELKNEDEKDTFNLKDITYIDISISGIIENKADVISCSNNGQTHEICGDPIPQPDIEDCDGEKYGYQKKDGDCAQWLGPLRNNRKNKCPLCTCGRYHQVNDYNKPKCKMIEVVALENCGTVEIEDIDCAAEDSSNKSFEANINKYYPNHEENKVHSGITYLLEIDQDLSDESESGDILVGYIDNISKENIKFPAIEYIPNAQGDNPKIIKECQKDDDDGYRCSIKIDSESENEYIFKRITSNAGVDSDHLRGCKVGDENVEKGKIFDVNSNPKEKTKIEIINCDNEITDYTENGNKIELKIELYKYHDLVMDYSGMLSFTKGASIGSKFPTYYAIPKSVNDINDLEEIKYSDTYNSSLEECYNNKCPYIKRGNKLRIFVTENDVIKSSDLIINSHHVPNIVCKDKLQNTSREETNYNCSSNVGNFFNFAEGDVSEDKDKCYICDVVEKCESVVGEEQEKDCSLLILGQECLEKGNDASCKESVYYDLYVGGDNGNNETESKFTKTQLDEIYKECRSTPKENRIISKELKYYKCYLREDRSDNDSIIRFYDSDKKEERYIKELQAKKSGELKFFFVKRDHEEYPYNYTAPKKSDVEVKYSYSSETITNGEGVEMYFHQESNNCKISEKEINIEFINGQLYDKTNDNPTTFLRKNTIESILGECQFDKNKEFSISFDMQDEYKKGYEGRYDIDIKYKTKPIFSQIAKNLTADILGFFDKQCDKCETDLAQNDKQCYEIKCKTASSQSDEQCDKIKCEPGLVQKLYNSLIEDSSYKNIVRIIFSLFFIFFGISYFFGLTDFKAKELIGIITKATVIYIFIDPNIGFYWFNQLFIEGFKGGLDFIIFEISNIFDYQSGNFSNQFLNNNNQSNKDINGIINNSFSILGIILSKQFIWKMIFLFISFPFGTLAFIYLVFPAWKMYLSLLIMVISTYFVAQIMISILFIFAPIFFVMLIFNSTREMFALWLKNLIGFSFQQIFIFITFGFFNIVIFGLMKLAFSYKACINDEYLLNHFGAIINMIAAFINPSIFIQSISKFILFYFVVKIALKMTMYMEGLSARISGSISLGAISAEIRKSAANLRDKAVGYSSYGAGQVSNVFRQSGLVGSYLADTMDHLSGGAKNLYKKNNPMSDDFLDKIDHRAFRSGKEDRKRREIHQISKGVVNEVKNEIRNSDDFKGKIKQIKEKYRDSENKKDLIEKYRSKLLAEELKNQKYYMKEKLEDKNIKYDDEVIDKIINESTKHGVSSKEKLKNYGKDSWNEFANSDKSIGGSFFDVFGSKTSESISDTHKSDKNENSKNNKNINQDMKIKKKPTSNKKL
jgi:type IV secretory pathway VirB6-like protein